LVQAIKHVISKHGRPLMPDLLGQLQRTLSMLGRWSKLQL
jgi:hypothetical protein